MTYDTIRFRFIMVNTIQPAISNYREEERHARPWLLTACLAAIILLASSGCALHPAYKANDLRGAMPKTWSAELKMISSTDRPLADAWWSELHDWAINKLVQAALAAARRSWRPWSI